ncbi:MAG: helix-turn-helix transcriptional regulator [Lachnospiraceae bacterium]|nr:helix-turn-helix transcriptional regulator [Lachnospiraceae bacterium]
MIFDRKKKKKDTTSTNESNTLMLKMVISYSAFLLIILVLFFALHRSTLSNAHYSYNTQKESTLVSNVELFENDLQIMETYCRQILQNDSFRKIMNYQNSYYPFTEYGNKVRTAMATDVYAESLLPIHETFCYLPLTDYVLTTSHFVSQNRFYHWIKKYPKEEQETFLNYLSNKTYHYRFVPMDKLTPNYSKSYYMYTIDMNDLFYMDANAMMSFVIDKDELSERFDCLQSNDNSFLIVMNNKNKTLLSICKDKELDITQILTLDYGETFVDIDYYGTTVTVGKYRSDNTGFTYYYSFPAFATTTNIDSQHTFFAAICLSALLAGGLFIFFLSRRNVRPIIELGQELHDAVEAQNHLQEVVDNQRPLICTSYVRQLLSGSITSEEEAHYIHDYLDINCDSTHYNVVYIAFYSNYSGSPEGISSEALSPETMSSKIPSLKAQTSELSPYENVHNIISGAINNFFQAPLYYFNPSDRTYSILLDYNEDKEKDFILKINNIILRIHDYLLDTYDIWLFAGIGKSTCSLMSIWESYQQAMEAVNYTTKNYIFYPYEFIKKNSNVFYYPPELSTKLIHFISTGNTAQVLELFNLIHQENIEERSLPINLLKFLLSDIRNSLLKARFALPANVDTEAVKQLDEHFNEHLSFKLCEDLALSLCRLFTVESEDSSLAVTIEKYIAQNYKDPSMGLNKISDEFQISESYFSHMFKEKTGVNFSTYLENLRMTEAARLIQETDISLNELYIAVGYNNANTFRRAFKKVYGVTPSTMREGSTDKK